MAAAKIAILVPAHDMVPALFAVDLAALTLWTSASLPDNVEFGINTVTGTYVHTARQQLIDDALEMGVTHMLWLDADMRVPRESLVHLLQHDVPVVGINYSKRARGHGFTALKKVGRGPAGEQLRTTDESTGLEEVEAIGFGCVLIRTSALKDLPDPRETPWFQNVYMGEGQWMGEDVHFCKLLREAGQKILVDHDLSKACAHIGTYEYATGDA